MADGMRARARRSRAFAKDGAYGKAVHVFTSDVAELTPEQQGQWAAELYSHKSTGIRLRLPALALSAAVCTRIIRQLRSLSGSCWICGPAGQRCQARTQLLPLCLFAALSSKTRIEQRSAVVGA